MSTKLHLDYALLDICSKLGSKALARTTILSVAVSDEKTDKSTHCIYSWILLKTSLRNTSSKESL